jgi:hypothetical protein
VRCGGSRIKNSRTCRHGSAGAAVSLAGGAAPAAAAPDGNGGPVLLGEANTATGTTAITNAGGAFSGNTSANGGHSGVHGNDTSPKGGYGVSGSCANGVAIYGESTNGYGVYATAPGGTGLLVQGKSIFQGMTEFSNSGVATVKTNDKSVTVKVAGITTTSIVRLPGLSGQRGTCGNPAPHPPRGP